MDSIDIYNYSNIKGMSRTPFKIYSWVSILIVSFLVFISYSTLFKYKTYLTYIGIVKNNYVEFYANKDFFTKKSENKVMINNEVLKYDIVAIEEYSYDSGNTEYWRIVLNVELEPKMKIENNRLTLRFLYKETTLYKDIMKKIKKGLRQWNN